MNHTSEFWSNHSGCCCQRGGGGGGGTFSPFVFSVFGFFSIVFLLSVSEVEKEKKKKTTLLFLSEQASNVCRSKPPSNLHRRTQTNHHRKWGTAVFRKRKRSCSLFLTQTKQDKREKKASRHRDNDGSELKENQKTNANTTLVIWLKAHSGWGEGLVGRGRGGGFLQY